MPHNKNTTAIRSLPFTEQGRRHTIIATLPPTKAQHPLSGPIETANAINASILAVRGVSTTATDNTLYTLAQEVLGNCEIDIAPKSFSSYNTASASTQDNIGTAAISSGDHENSCCMEANTSPCKPDKDSEATCSSSETPVNTFEPFYFFFYGSLQVRNVLHRVIGLRSNIFSRSSCDMSSDEPKETAPFLENASIQGWKIKMWGPYPALVPAAADEAVQGTAWLCDKPEYVPRLCTYESDAYRMAYCDVSVPAADGNGVEVIKNARTFVSDLDDEDLEDGEFDLEGYQKSSLAM
ncbi:hypothetical protein ONZ43_g1259 [Nemania bipapillata]|uniref:Uncharacterized protein n=1 Tax=Nemania bipapillata TaxID=110536 RepID=A0ACC2J552_9PEZI|nr:hypothetical protein ONZ43_g1259 [Nemania bipapillata]